MKKKYKALMLDLDGTTVHNSPEGMPSEKVIKAVLQAHKKLFVCLVTGRPLWRTESIMDALQITSPTVLLGGSQIVAGGNHEYVYERSLQKEDIEQILEILKPYHQQILIEEKRRSFLYNDSYKYDVIFNMFIKHLTSQEADKILIALSHIKTIEAVKVVSWVKGEVALNISHALGTKQHGVFEVAKILNIETQEIIGVGDGYNDFPMLMACGLKVAMENAVPELKAIADYIAPSVDNDGVAEVIEKFVL
jgi:hypothetical protein